MDSILKEHVMDSTLKEHVMDSILKEHVMKVTKSQEERKNACTLPLSKKPK